ncbi:MAG: YbjN domain-containing protein [Myxococcota bacterium]
MAAPTRSEKLDPTPETVERLLAAGGWNFTRLTDDTWRGRFRCSTGRHFPYLVRLDRETRWLTFAVVPFVRSPENEVACRALYDRLLQLNQVVMMAKFSIDDDLDVVLSVDYPIEQLDESEFVDAMNALAYYADAHHGELLDLLPA